MSLWVVLGLALLTYASRAAAVVLLPPPPARLARYLDRVPAPLFSGLAALALVSGSGALAAAPTLGALAGGVLAAPTRSLPAILAAGLLGAVAGTALG